MAWHIARFGMLRGGWLPGYLRHHQPFRITRLAKDAPIHLIVFLVDHFEPSADHGPDAAAESVVAWCEAHAQLAGRHADADDRPLQHTWFYRAEYPNPGCLSTLAEAVYRGFGEVEFHLHHGHDTHETFAAKLHAGLDFFNQFGAMRTCEPNPRRRFAYIAGNWALDNGAGNDALSGCNTELTALREAGCYADFTFPAIGSRAQPRKTNAIYYATDDPAPKSYDTGVDVEVGRPPVGDLMIFQGPLAFDRRRGCFDHPGIEFFDPPRPDRLGAWLNANIHVAGRPEWIFIKMHTHGMQSRTIFQDGSMDALLDAMDQEWNRLPFRLHFATAREAYNMVKAAEAGHSGDPHLYRDFAVAPPANRRIACDAPWQLQAFSPNHVRLEVHGDQTANLRLKGLPLARVRGAFQHLDVTFADGRITGLDVQGRGEFEVEGAFQAGHQCQNRRVSREELHTLLAAV
jgi:hypothetical protein